MVELVQELIEVGPANKASVAVHLNQIWDMVLSDTSTRSLVQSKGIDIDALESLEHMPFGAMEARAGSGLGVTETVVIGVAINITSHAVIRAYTELWVKVVKPALESRYPDIKEIKPAKEDTDDKH